MAEFATSPTALVADVDCTAKGKALCDEVGVKGYPTIKYGDPNDMEDYDGGRSLKDLKKFATEKLGPQCSPTNLDLCDEEKTAKIKELMALSSEDLKSQIEEKKNRNGEVGDRFQ
jgi:hypothetical protein